MTGIRPALRLAQPRLLLRSPDRYRDPTVPVFVIGSGRSGNTLLRRVLMASGEIYLPPESYVMGDIISEWPLTAPLPWERRVWLFCAHIEKHRHFETFGLPNLGAFAAEAAAMPKRERTLRGLFDRFFLHLARAAGSTAMRWGEKSPWNTHHLPTLGALFPEAAYLWLIRDGRDVALSYVEAGFYPDLRSAARRWTVANRACLGFSRWCRDMPQLRYERLVSDPETEFGGLFERLGLTFAPDMLARPVGVMGDVEYHAHHGNVRRPISASSVGRWRTALRADAFDDMDDVFWALMDRFGYERT